MEHIKLDLTILVAFIYRYLSGIKPSSQLIPPSVLSTLPQNGKDCAPVSVGWSVVQSVTPKEASS